MNWSYGLSRWLVAGLLCLPGWAFAQQSKAGDTPLLKFDVVTVKPNKTQAQITLIDNDEGTTMKIENASLQMMIMQAFDLQDYMIEGIQDWAKNQHFDVRGKILEATPEQIKALTPEQRRAMLYAVLQERFGLKTHWVTRDKPLYVLGVAKGGSKLAESTAKLASSALNYESLDAEAITPDDLTRSMAYIVQKPVLNRTALTGKYDVHLKWSREDAMVNGERVQDEPTAPSIFTAVKETLGLELKATHGPAQVLLVDAASLPTAD